jgi:Zn-dependent alcohol dehydrogenase
MIKSPCGGLCRQAPSQIIEVHVEPPKAAEALVGIAVTGV